MAKKAKRPRITIKDRKVIKATLEGKSRQQAGEIAGFSKKSAQSQASQSLQKPIVKETLCQALDRIGCSDDFLARKTFALLDAKKTVSCVSGKDAGAGSVDFIDVPDNTTQHATLRTALQVKGHLKEKLAVDIGLSEDVPRRVAEAIKEIIAYDPE